MSSSLPIVSIVGRRNVGKSTLFNALIKERRAIVDPVPGLTRDVLSCTVSHKTAHFFLTDTPGLDLPDSSELSAPILENAKKHLEKSAVIIILMESPAPSSFDIDLVDIIRKLSKPFLIAVNKIDTGEMTENMVNFYEMGLQDPIPISAKRRTNLPLLLDRIHELLPSKKGAAPGPDLKISIVGRQNSGKSTLLNAFIGFERVVVSDVPGTTRDSIDEEFTYERKKIRVIDTAGIRRKSRVKDSVDYYSMTRSIEAINRSDVVVHLIDAEFGITETDKKISDAILKAHKPIIIAINKWDAIEKDDKTFEAYRDRLLFKYYRAGDFPIISISAKNKIRIHKILKTALSLREKALKKISTPALNRVVQKIQESRNAPRSAHKLKIYYATRTQSTPPRFKLFVNNRDYFTRDIIRYLEKLIQKELDLKGIPIVLQIEGRKKRG